MTTTLMQPFNFNFKPLQKLGRRLYPLVLFVFDIDRMVHPNKVRKYAVELWDPDIRDTALDYWTMGTVTEIREYARVSSEKPFSAEHFSRAALIVVNITPQGKIA